MINTKIIRIALLATLLLVTMGFNGSIGKVAAANSGYSTQLIGELGEASTVLIYAQIDAIIRIPVPDADWGPTADFFTVSVSTGAMGSGSFISADGYIATAGHVVFALTHTDITQDLYVKPLLVDASYTTLVQALQDEGYTVTADEQATLKAYVETYGTLQDSLRTVYAILGEVSPTLTSIQAKGWIARVVSVSPFIQNDLALLKVELTNCPVLKVGDSSTVLTGDDVSMFGFPGVVTFHAQLGSETTLAPSMTRGIISASKVTTGQTPVFQTDAALTHGNSGGAGLNNNGEIIGICSMGSISDTGQEVAGFNFLIKGAVLKTMMTEVGVNNTQGPIDDHFLKGVQYYYDKHYTAAKAEFETVAGLFAYHWRAKALITECNTAIANGKDVPISSGVDFTLIIAIVVVAVIVVVVAVMLFMRKRQGKPILPPPPPPGI
ncbi:MAG TPA: serine protease [Candidatus Bathyarchaeia archaeon]